MRIIAGSAKGREIFRPRSKDTRPVTDYVREAIFDILGPIDHLSVLDVYAGSGSLGLEALSRGANRVDAVERSPNAARVIRRNITKLSFSDRYVIFRESIEKWLEDKKHQNKKYDLIFADPPYEQIDTEVIAQLSQHLNTSGLLILLYSRRTKIPELAGLELARSRKHGDTIISFYRI